MIFIIPLCTIFIILGSWLCIKGIKKCLSASRSKNWTQVQCLVLSSIIEESKNSDGDPMFEAKVSYQYHHNGSRYIGNKIYFGYGSSSEKNDSLEIINLLPEGKTISVYFNPENPNEAVLIPGIQRFTLINVWGGFGFAFLGIWFLVMWYLFTGGQADIFHKTISGG